MLNGHWITLRNVDLDSRKNHVTVNNEQKFGCVDSHYFSILKWES